MNTEHVYQVVLETLKNIPMKEYEKEEKELQPYLKTEISKALEISFPGEYEIKMSVGGKNSPRVHLLGTNFWPDIEVSKNGEPLVAVEVKLAKKSFATALSETIGQCLIYKLKYKHVIGFIKNQARTHPKYNEFDAQFEEMLRSIRVPLIVR